MIKYKKVATSAKARTVVTFNSKVFNTSEPKDYFINSCCFGDDVAKWLIDELRKMGLRTDDEPGQEDFGWYFNFQIADLSHTIVIGYRPGRENAEGTWVAWLERNRGFIGSLFGARKRGIAPSAAAALHSILSSSPQVQDLQWHFQHDFDGHEEHGSPTP